MGSLFQPEPIQHPTRPLKLYLFIQPVRPVGVVILRLLQLGYNFVLFYFTTRIFNLLHIVSLEMVIHV